MTELILVQSKIRAHARDSLSKETFKKWYDTVHMRDLLLTPGISVALRYQQTASPEPEFPYLAVYPRVSREWVHSPTCEFLRVPLCDPMLPGERGAVFESADFVMGAYEEYGGQEAVEEEEGGVLVPAKALVFVPVDSSVVGSAAVADVLSVSTGGLTPRRSQMLRYDFSPAGQQPRHAEIAKGELFVGGEYVAMHEFDEVPEGVVLGKGAVVYMLIGALGDVRQE
ncbi:hypothetical protein QBC47DRAFT_88993 [Echria macrotheca]|uniref:Uncharacterized protein n=1 Tax=Echria macrotheca TaxID=438768 RepID=A0AAJ0B473_9PEZI|nr:hypothetical protein QBC47DRAFT_88993 [Echria macrotheca]